MPVFNYKGIDGRGKEVKGLVDVDGEKALRSHLKRQGIYLTEYREGSKKQRRSGRLRSMAGPEGQSGGLLGKDVGLGNLFSGVKLIEVAEITRAVVDQLPEKFRTILVLREFEGLAYNEIAEVLGCQLGTVESRLFRARKRFKDAMSQQYPELLPTLALGRGGKR